MIFSQIREESLPKFHSYFGGMKSRHYLVLGCGGGGDIAGCLPLAKWLHSSHTKITLASLTWERSAVIEGYGPRPFSEISGLVSFDNQKYLQTYFPDIEGRNTNPEKLGEIKSVKLGDESTVIRTETKDVLMQATRVAKVLQQPVVYLDINHGVKQLVEDLNEVISLLGIDGVICLDVGGDVLARGNEPGLSSPLADAISLACCAQIKVPSLLAIYAPNCDGELTLEELADYFEEFDQEGLLIGMRSHSSDEMEYLKSILEQGDVITEASRQPLHFFHGNRGESAIRGGKRHVSLNPAIMATYFFKLPELLSYCPLAQALLDNTSLLDANALLLDEFRLISEYEFEKRQYEQGLQKPISYD